MEKSSLSHRIEHLSHYIPSQGPIKDFIHHNTLHAFQNLKFDEGVWRASQLFGARYSLSPHEVPLGFVKSGMRRKGFQSYGVNIERRTQKILFRLLGHFLDQGISHQNIDQPLAFWKWLRKYFSSSFLNFDLLSSPTAHRLLMGSAESAIEECLNDLVKDPKQHDRYLLEILLSHPGWSGLVNQVHLHPKGLFHTRSITLIEMLALDLVMDRVVAEEIRGFEKFELKKDEPVLPEEIKSEVTSEFARLRKMHEQLENKYYRSVYEIFQKKKSIRLKPREKKFQVFFCIDDRECSLRRHLESASSEVTTYGVAGFFGLDCLVQEAGYPYAVQSCPVVLSPTVVIKEVPQKKIKRRNWHHHYTFSKVFGKPFIGFLVSPFFGMNAAYHLIKHVLFKQELNPVKRVKSDLEIGYTLDEKAQRVFNVLKTTGFDVHHAQLVFLLGHEASSTNNPHYAAYDCGACSGRTGAVNARAFAQIANDPEVRLKLSEKGMKLPDHCYFVGGVHNTTRDQITFFDQEQIPESYKADFLDFVSLLEEVLPLNALERCRKFELAPANLSPDSALKHVRERAIALFEPRPELNHATNAGCFVGRRATTEGLNFDRRMFMNSYDPAIDPDGTILTGILNAVVPVCGGINLEYYFSRLDPEVYGAGTKLPHNVVGLLGVSNGVDTDLRTGLPTQMTEVHDPLRLLIIVEHEPEIALKAVQRNPATYEWVKNDWVKYACITSNGEFWWLKGEAWVRELSE